MAFLLKLETSDQLTVRARGVRHRVSVARSRVGECAAVVVRDYLEAAGLHETLASLEREEGLPDKAHVRRAADLLSSAASTYRLHTGYHRPLIETLVHSTLLRPGQGRGATPGDGDYGGSSDDLQFHFAARIPLPSRSAPRAAEDGLPLKSDGSPTFGRRSPIRPKRRERFGDAAEEARDTREKIEDANALRHDLNELVDLSASVRLGILRRDMNAEMCNREARRNQRVGDAILARHRAAARRREQRRALRNFDAMKPCACCSKEFSLGVMRTLVVGVAITRLKQSWLSESDRAVAIAMDEGKGRNRAEWLRRYDLRRVCVFCAQFFKAKEKRQGRKKMTGSERADRDGAR